MARDGGEMRRVEVGFTGGQVILMRLPDKAYDQLRRALQDAKRLVPRWRRRTGSCRSTWARSCS